MGPVHNPLSHGMGWLQRVVQDDESTTDSHETFVTNTLEVSTSEFTTEFPKLASASAIQRKVRFYDAEIADQSKLDEHCGCAGWRDFARPEARVGATFEFTEFPKPQRSRTARAGMAERHNSTVLENSFQVLVSDEEGDLVAADELVKELKELAQVPKRDVETVTQRKQRLPLRHRFCRPGPAHVLWQLGSLFS